MKFLLLFLLASPVLAQTAMPPEVKAESTPMAAIRELEKRLEQRFVYTELAIQKAEAAMNYRLEGMNEFRAQLNNQQNTFVTRDMLDASLKSIDLRLRSLEDQQSRQSGYMAAGGLFLTVLSIGLKMWQPKKPNEPRAENNQRRR